MFGYTYVRIIKALRARTDRCSNQHGNILQWALLGPVTNTLLFLLILPFRYLNLGPCFAKGVPDPMTHVLSRGKSCGSWELKVSAAQGERSL